MARAKTIFSWPFGPSLDDEMLQKFFDDELSLRQRRDFLKRLEANSEELTTKLSNLDLLRSQYRNWFNEEAEEVRLWSQISEEVESLASKRKKPRWREMIGFSNLRPQMFLAPTAFAAACVLVLAFGISRNSDKASPAMSPETLAKSLTPSSLPINLEHEPNSESIIKVSRKADAIADTFPSSFTFDDLEINFEATPEFSKGRDSEKSLLAHVDEGEWLFEIIREQNTPQLLAIERSFAETPALTRSFDSRVTASLNADVDASQNIFHRASRR